MTERAKLKKILMNVELFPFTPSNLEENINRIVDALIANGVRAMPFVAMIEKTTVNGEFCKKKSEQKFNGRYCVVYEDKTKWETPLIDICGLKPYDKCEAIEEMVMKGDNE